MARERVAIIWNPAKTTREDLESALVAAVGRSERDPVVSWWETSVDDPGQQAAADAVAAGADVLVAAGGDGTVRAVAEYLARAQSNVELAIVPLGTGNLLARNLGVPLNRIEAALIRAFTAEADVIDFAWADVGPQGAAERHGFAVMGGFGIDAHMITETDDELKSKAGWLAYVESLGRAVSASEVIDIRLSVDGGPLADERAHTVLVGNCGTVQGGIALLPDADASDGELDLVVLRADTALAWLDTMRNMMWDNGIKPKLFGSDEAESADSVDHTRAKTLLIELSEPRVFEVDGEDLGEATRVAIEVQPGALRIR